MAPLRLSAHDHRVRHRHPRCQPLHRLHRNPTQGPGGLLHRHQLDGRRPRTRHRAGGRRVPLRVRPLVDAVRVRRGHLGRDGGPLPGSGPRRRQQEGQRRRGAPLSSSDHRLAVAPANVRVLGGAGGRSAGSREEERKRGCKRTKGCSEQQDVAYAHGPRLGTRTVGRYRVRSTALALLYVRCAVAGACVETVVCGSSEFDFEFGENLRMTSPHIHRAKSGRFLPRCLVDVSFRT